MKKLVGLPFFIGSLGILMIDLKFLKKKNHLTLVYNILANRNMSRAIIII